MPAWQESLPADIMVDVNGTSVPLRDTQFVKEAPDLTTFAKTAYDAHREVGSRIPVKVEKVRAADGTFVPKTESVAAWRKDHLPKLYDAGILERPLESPEAYGVKKPDDFPDTIAWSDELALEASKVAHKYNVPKAALEEFIKLHNNVLTAQSEVFKTDEATAEAALRREFPTDFDSRLEDTKRLTKVIFTKPEELEAWEKSGLANHPLILGPLMRLAPLAKQDSSMGVKMSESTGTATREAVQSELADIIGNPQNPRHKLYLSGDPATNEYVDNLYKKIPGASEKVTIG